MTNSLRLRVLGVWVRVSSLNLGLDVIHYDTQICSKLLLGSFSGCVFYLVMSQKWMMKMKSVCILIKILKFLDRKLNTKLEWLKSVSILTRAGDQHTLGPQHLILEHVLVQSWKWMWLHVSCLDLTDMWNTQWQLESLRFILEHCCCMGSFSQSFTPADPSRPSSTSDSWM